MELKYSKITRKGPVTIVTFVALFLYSAWNWRCPGCRFFLAKNPRVCARCKLPLRPAPGEGDAP